MPTRRLPSIQKRQYHHGWTLMKPARQSRKSNGAFAPSLPSLCPLCLGGGTSYGNLLGITNLTTETQRTQRWQIIGNSGVTNLTTGRRINLNFCQKCFDFRHCVTDFVQLYPCKSVPLSLKIFASRANFFCETKGPQQGFCFYLLIRVDSCPFVVESFVVAAPSR